MLSPEDRLEQLRRGNERVVDHTMTHVAPFGLRAFFLLCAYGICLLRAAVYVVREPFLRYRDYMVSGVK